MAVRLIKVLKQTKRILGDIELFYHPSSFLKHKWYNGTLVHCNKQQPP